MGVADVLFGQEQLFMSGFDKRKKGFEGKFAHDAEH